MEPFFHEASTMLFNFLLIPVALFSATFFLVALYGILHRERPRTMHPTKRWPWVTVQIPTKNELAALRCAQACLQFDYPAPFDIIIGDDSTDLSISRQIDAFAKEHPQVQITRRGTNIGYKPGNLNYMLRFSRGEVIVIFDSDFIPDKNFLREIVKPFADDEVACVQAKWNYLNLSRNRISKFASSILMVYHHLLAPINDRLGVSLLFGSAEAVRTSALKKLGGWKDWSMTEDVEFTLRALKAGYKTVYLKNVSVPGEVPFTLWSLARQQKRWAYGNAKAFFDNSRWILFGGRFSLPQKLALMLTLVGYISAPFLVAFMLLGFMVWFTGTPGTIDIAKFSLTTGQIFLINSGFLTATFVALAKERQIRTFPSIVATSLTSGIWIAVSVFDGLMKAVAGKKMPWYLIRKMGNETAPFPREL